MFVAQSKEGFDWIKTKSGEIVSKENIDTFIPKLDTNSARNELKKLQHIQTKINMVNGSWDDYKNSFGKNQKYLLDYAKQNDVFASSVDNIKNVNEEARASAIAQNESIKAQTLSAKAGSAAFSALATAGNMLVSWGISEAINLIYSCATASDRLLERAAELGSQFSSTKSDINGYKTEIDNLYKIINDNSSSYEDTYNARQELLSMQDEMIKKFGSEAEAAKLVTDAINGQTGTLDSLTEREWQETKNAFKSGSGKGWIEKAGDSWSNFWSGSTDNFDRMKKEMENGEVTFFIDPMLGNFGDFQKKLEEIFGAETNKFRSLPRDFEEAMGTNKGVGFTLSGNLNEIYDKLLNIQSLAENMGIEDTFLKDLSEQTSKTKEKLDGYNEFYTQSVLYDKINPNEDYKQSFDEINREHQKFQNIYASGDETAIAEAKQSYAETVQNAITGVNDQSVIDYFNNMYPELRESVGSWEFEVEFKAAINDNNDEFENDIKDALDSFDTSEEILNFNSKNATGEQIDDYTELQLIANKYNLTLDELINKMIEMGLVASQSKEDLLNRLLPDKKSTAGVGNLLHDSLNQVNADFITDWVNSLSQEDALLADSKEFESALESQKEKLNGAALSIDNYNAALESLKSKGYGKEQNQSPLSFQQAWDSIDTTENEELNGMKGNLLTLAGTGRLTRDTFNETEGSSTFLSMLGIKPEDKTEIDVLISKINQLKSSSEQLSSMKNGISGLSDNLSYREQNPGEAISSDVLVGMDSGLKDQTEEWKQYEFVLGNAGSSMDEVREATNKLASAYVNNNNFLANLTEANKDYYVSQLDSMGVANSAEIVEERVNAQKEVAEYKTHALSLATKDLKDSQASYTQRSVDCVNATYENSTAFARQTEMTDLARILLADLVAQESIFASTDLNTSAKISELNKLAYAYFDVANAIQISSAMGSDPRYWNNPGDYEKAVHNNWDNLFKKQKQGLPVNLNSSHLKNTDNTGNTNKSPDKQPDKQPEEREFKESFNWVERFIKKFQNAFDKWLAQAETALTSKFLDIYYKKAATSAKNQLSSYDKAYNRYMREANAIGLDEKYARKVRNGTINIEEIYAKGSEDDVKKYEELAKKIKDYQNWYDKAQDSMNSFREIAEKLYNLPLDKAAKKVDIFGDAIDLLNKELDNETDYKNKNKMIGNKGDKNKNTLSSYKKATLNSYKTAESDTEKALNNARKELRKSKNLNKDDGITAKERKIIKKATKSKDAKKNKEINLAYFKENSAGYKKAVKYNEALKAYKKAANDAASAQQDYNAWLVEASKLKFDNIADHYDKKVQMFGYDMSSYDNTISEIEASGKKVHKFHYESQRNINQNILSQYLAEKTDLEKSLNNITEGTDEWYDAYDKIQQVSTAISECKQKTCELNNAINQLHFDMFDDISEGIERIVSEQEFLQGLFAHEKTTDKTTGNFTEAGLAKLGSLAVIHYAYEDDLERYSTEITELKRMLASGTLQSSTLGLTFNSRDDAEAYLEKMYDQYRDVKNKMYGIDTEIHNRMEEFYQTELDYLSELIGAKKEALNAEKDLHDYQRTISEKTEGIANIRKQIAAYSGDTSQEGMAKLQRLQKELTDREDDLKETEYNRLISDQQDMLDKLYDEYSQKLEEKMENFMVLVQEGLGKANDNMSVIRDYLEKIANDSKYDLEINGLFEGSGKIDTNVENATSQIAKDKNAQYESTKPNVTTPAPTPKKNTPKKNNKKNTNKKNNNKKKSSNSKKKSSGSKKNGSQQEIVLKEFTPKRITPKTKQVLEISQDFLHLEPDIPFKDYRNQNSFIRDSLELETLTGNSLERTSNTYAVFDAKKPKISSEHILDATIPTFSINDVVPDLSATPRINNVSNVVNIDSITLPNVTNYDEFKDRMFHDMQNDGHYIQFINDASVNRADGTGRLTKNTQTL